MARSSRYILSNRPRRVLDQTGAPVIEVDPPPEGDTTAGVTTGATVTLGGADTETPPTKSEK